VRAEILLYCIADRLYHFIDRLYHFIFIIAIERYVNTAMK